MPWYRHPIRVANRRGELLIDDRFRAQAPVRELPELHWVGVWCRERALRPAFITPTEEPILIELERKLVEIAGRVAGGWAVYLMRVMSQGLIEFYFYGRDANALAGVSEELQRLFPEHRIEQNSRPDPEWAEYLRQCGNLN